MKKLKLVVYLLISATFLFGQTKAQRLSITTGFGFQQYCGDLGNGFYDFSSTEYGVANLGLDFYLNRFLDLKFFGTLGDLGYCSDFEEGENGVVEDVLNSRMTMGSISLKFKFSNGTLLPENSRLSPYLYAGFGLNRITDIMEMGCIIPGNYRSVNTGIGLLYNVSSRFLIGYNLNVGQLSSDRIDFVNAGRNDLYMQNSFMIGVNLFNR